MFPFPTQASLVAVALATALGLSGCGRPSATSPAFRSTGINSGTTTGANQLKGSITGGVRVLSGGAGSATGSILGPDGRPVAGAKVVAEPGGMQAVSAPDGSFRFDGLAEGNYTFKAVVPGLSQAMPAGTLVAGGTVNEVPAISLVAGGAGGGLGITSIQYRHEATFADRGQAPGLLVAPIGLALKQGNTVVLDRNSSALVHTGILRQYRSDGSFEGKYGDYSKWLGLGQLKDDVKTFAIDAQGMTWVIDGSNKLWRFDVDGGKQGTSNLSVEGINDFAIHPKTGIMLLGSASGLTKLNGAGEGPQAVGDIQGEVKAVAFAKDGGYWTIQGQQVVHISEQGQAGLSFGGLTEPVDLAVDPTNGVLFVVDAGTKNVMAFDPAGSLIGKVGDGMFESPKAVAVDATGKVSVLDAGKKKVYRFFPAGAQ